MRTSGTKKNLSPLVLIISVGCFEVLKVGVASRSGHLPPLPCIPLETVTPCTHTHLLLGTAGLLWKGQVTAAVGHVSDEPRNLLTMVGKGQGSGSSGNPRQ